MPRFAPALLLSLGSVFAGSAAAAPYIGVMYGEFTMNSRYVSGDLDFTGPTLRLGATVSEWVGLEVRTGFSNSTDKGGVSYKIQHYATGLVRLGFPRQDKRVVPYVFGGLTYADLDTEPSAIPFINDTTGLTYGIGIDLFADAHRGLTFEWMRIDDKENGVEYQIEHLGVGYTHRF